MGSGSSPLPVTGFGTVAYALVGLGLVVVGGAAWLVSKVLGKR